MTTKEFTLFQELIDAKFKSVHIQLNSEFSTLNERINSTNEILDRVEKQTTKTNGRVSILEDKGKDHVINCPRIADVNEIYDRIENEKLETTKQLGIINKDLEEYRFFKKYPKIALGIIIVACIGLFIASYATFTKKANTIFKEIATEVYMDSLN